MSVVAVAAVVEAVLTFVEIIFALFEFVFKSSVAFLTAGEFALEFLFFGEA